MIAQNAWKFPKDIVYPESDGKRLAENSLQLRWIVTLYGNLASMYRDQPDIFVGSDQLWYPVEGEPSICTAPDAYVVFGRPKGERPLWMQWKEENTPMTVVFEVLSPGNDTIEMIDKHAFYEDYGVEEYYVYDPDRVTLGVFLRRGSVLRRERNVNGFVSPRLGIRFDLTSEREMVVYGPNGSRFLTFEQVTDRLEREQQRAESEHQRAESERQRAESERQRADQEHARFKRLAELSRSVRNGTATPEEIAELERLVGEATT